MKKIEELPLEFKCATFLQEDNNAVNNTADKITDDSQTIGRGDFVQFLNYKIAPRLVKGGDTKFESGPTS